VVVYKLHSTTTQYILNSTTHQSQFHTRIPFIMPSPTTNTAWTIPATATKVSDLVKQTFAIPSPGPHQVLVKLTAASLNFRDVLISTRSPYCTFPCLDCLFTTLTSQQTPATTNST
jgi:hypothetical protein